MSLSNDEVKARLLPIMAQLQAIMDDQGGIPPSGGAPAPVQIAPMGGSLKGPVMVTLLCPTAGALIYYNLTGDTVSPSKSAPYIGPFTLTAPFSSYVRACAFLGAIAGQGTEAKFNVS